MGVFKDHGGGEWDLKDHKTYVDSWFPNKFLKLSSKELVTAIKQEIGASLHYMLCWTPGCFGYNSFVDEENPLHGRQLDRVIKLGVEFHKELKGFENTPGFTTDFATKEIHRVWLLSQLFLLLDETENQC